MSSVIFREDDEDDKSTQAFNELLEDYIIVPQNDAIENCLPHDKLTRQRTRQQQTTENARGISEEYMAMTKACIHDHDYFSVDQRDPYPPRDQPVANLVLTDSVIHKIDIGQNGIEVKPEIHRRVRSRRIIRKSTTVMNADAKPSKPVSSPTKASLKQILVIRNCSDSLSLNVPSPRPSITPFPPVEKGFRRLYDDKKLHRSEELIDNQHSLDFDDNPMCNTSSDSAYESLTLSSSSQQRSSTSRPPSGGKRSAAGGISSSSSSDVSSDESSDAERRVHVQDTLRIDPDADNSEDKSLLVHCNRPKRQEETVVVRSRHVTRSGRKIRKHVPRAGHSPPLSQDQKSSQYIPTPPPSKPKKGKPII